MVDIAGDPKTLFIVFTGTSSPMIYVWTDIEAMQKCEKLCLWMDIRGIRQGKMFELLESWLRNLVALDVLSFFVSIKTELRFFKFF